MTIPDEDPRLIAIPIIRDHLSAIIDHANDAMDTAHNNDMPDEAEQLLLLKVDAWAMFKKLKSLNTDLTHAK
jgi:hypothetical protein